MSMNKSRENEPRMNDEIRTPTIRLIDPEGNMIGVVPVKQGLAMAEQYGLDLVEISPDAEPPVAKIMDFGKHIYEAKKQQAAAKKNQVRTQVKEMKFRPGTEEGDYQVKLRNLVRFLEHGDKAKVTLRFRGREMAHQEIGMELIKRIETDLDAWGTVEQHAKMEGRQLTMVVAPKKKK